MKIFNKLEECKQWIIRVVSGMLQPLPEPECKICKDRKEIEVIVMGTDTDWVECPYCSPKEEYKKFQEWQSIVADLKTQKYHG
jgi:hypothetical protein